MLNKNSVIKRTIAFLLLVCMVVSGVYYPEIVRATDTAEVLVVDDENAKSGGANATVNSEAAYVKTGEKSYKCATKAGVTRVFIENTSLGNIDISSVTGTGPNKNGALRFWIYVDSAADAANWNYTNGDKPLVRLGSDSTDNYYIWQGWNTQITKDGWNEIILTFDSVYFTKGTPDVTKINYILINKMSTDIVEVYIDNIRVSTDTTIQQEPEEPQEPSVVRTTILDDENAVAGGGNATINGDYNYIKEGDASYQCTTKTGATRIFIENTSLGNIDISSVTGTGPNKNGALRFWIYVDSAADAANWNYTNGDKPLVRLGSDSTDNYYIWQGWNTQITKDGWNEIILTFDSVYFTKGTPDVTKINYIYINKMSTDIVTVYIDYIHVSTDTTVTVEPEEPSSPSLEMILDDEFGERGGDNATINEDAQYVKVGEKSYKSTTKAGNSVNFIEAKMAQERDISVKKDNGALSFWIYVEDKSIISGWSTETVVPQVQLGSAGKIDVDCYKWDNWHNQITENGWNQIVLPFSKISRTNGTPVDAAINYVLIRKGNTDTFPTVYIDNLRVVKYTPQVVEPNVILNDEDDAKGGDNATIITELTGKVKVGNKAYKSTTKKGNSTNFIATKLDEPRDISSLKTGTALTFWIYVEDKSIVSAWSTKTVVPQVQLGSAGRLDADCYKWDNWHSQITDDGWNQIVLPFSKVSRTTGTPVDTAINYVLIRKGNIDTFPTVYIDDIRISTYTAPKANADLILDDEIFESGGTCASIGTEQVKVGKVSYKATPGAGNNAYWLIQTTLPRPLNIKQKTENGTKGSVAFWIYVKDRQEVIDLWKGSQVQLGESMDKNVFKWNNWDTQIKTNGWNQIVLNFNTALVINGTPNSSNLKYFCIRTQNSKMDGCVYYIDEIRISQEELKVDSSVTINGALMFHPYEDMGGMIFDTTKTTKLWMDTEEKKQGDSSMAFVSDTGGFTYQYMPVSPVDASAYNCLEFDIYVPKADFFEYATQGIEISSGGTMDVEELSWQFLDISLEEGWNHIQLSFDRPTNYTKDWKNEANINLAAINYMRFYAVGAELYNGTPLLWRIDNMQFTKNGLPPLEEANYETVNNTGLHVYLTAAKGVLSTYGRFTVQDIETSELTGKAKTYFENDEDALVLQLSFEKDGIECFFEDTVKVNLEENNAYSIPEKYRVYRVDINDAVTPVPVTNKGDTLTWAEDDKLTTYVISTVDVSELQTEQEYEKGDGIRTLYKVTIVVASTLLVAGVAAIAIVHIKRKRKGGN